MAEVHLESVGFTYPGSADSTLHGLDLNIDHGCAHALLGASGTGKTTMLNLLSGLLHPTEGSIRFDSVDVSELGARERNVALVFQFPVLYESKTVLENLMFPLVNRGWKVVDARARAREVAGELELESALEMKPERLSLFQKQLAAIGKSLVRTDVDLVLLDEPLTAVDPAVKWRLRQILSRYQQGHELTTVYVTHDQTEALTFADHVSVMAEGSILQTGTPEEIYDQPVSREVAEFVGSPGMQLVPCRVTGGEIDLPGFSCREKLYRDGGWTLGVRSAWCDLVDEEASPWQVTASRLLGTRQGEEIRLVTVMLGEMRLFAETVMDCQIGQRVAIRADRVVLFESDDGG